MSWQRRPSGARRPRGEGALTIIGSWDFSQFAKLSAPFKARFPDIKLSYVRGGLYDRGVKTMVALKHGSYLADIIIGAGGDWVELPQHERARRPQRPADLQVPAAEMHDRKGSGSARVAYRCMAYNTKLVKKADLPQDLGRPGRHNRAGATASWACPTVPTCGFLMLWQGKGPQWTKDFMTKLFTQVKPQLRKEGANAMVALTVAGEFDAAVRSAEYRIQQYQDKGAPISFHCPAPVPMAVSLLVVLKGNPQRDASLIFTNWFLSKEGQIAQYRADNAISVRPDLSRHKELMPYPEEIEGKPLAVRDEEALITEYPKLIAAYDPLWKGAGGPVAGKLRTVSVRLTDVKRSGRVITFDLKGKKTEVGISGKRTRITVDGAKARRSALKAGMSCKVTYATGENAKSVACAK